MVYFHLNIYKIVIDVRSFIRLCSNSLDETKKISSMSSIVRTELESTGLSSESVKVLSNGGSYGVVRQT